MKKIIIPLILSTALASSASAEYFTLTSENNTFTSTIPAATLSTYTGFTGEVCKFSYSSAAFNVGAFTQDFTFDSGISVTSTATASNTFIFDINNGVTVTINSKFDVSSINSFRLWLGTSYADAKRGKIVINSTLAKTGVNTPLLFIFNKEVETNQKLTISEIDFFSNASFKTSVDQSAQLGFRGTNQLYSGTISKAFKVDSTKSGVRNIGTIVLDGASHSTTGFYVNQTGDEKDAANYQHVFTVQFAQAGAAEAFKINDSTASADRKLSALMGGSLFDGFLFENMEIGDEIYSNVNLLDSTYAEKIFINDSKIADLVNSGALSVSSDDIYGYIYTMIIPEPAEYAALLGALTIALALMRKRK